MTTALPLHTTLRRGPFRRNVVNPADYATRGAKDPSKAERDRIRRLLDGRTA